MGWNPFRHKKKHSSPFMPKPEDPLVTKEKSDLDTEMGDYGNIAEHEREKTKADMIRAGTWSGTAQGDESANAESEQRTIGAQQTSLAHINALRASLGLPPLQADPNGNFSSISQNPPTAVGAPGGGSSSGGGGVGQFIIGGGINPGSV